MGPGFGYLGSIQFQWEERQCGGSVVDVNVKSYYYYFFFCFKYKILSLVYITRDSRKFSKNKIKYLRKR